MDIKWKNIDKKKIIVSVIAIYTVIALVFVILEIYKYTNYPVLNLTFVLGMAYILFCFAEWIFRYVEKKYRGDVKVYVEKLKTVQKRCIYAGVAYFFVIYLLLRCLSVSTLRLYRPLFSLSDSILGELYRYNMDWIALALLTGPIFSFVLPLCLKILQELVTINFEMSEQNKTQKELMAELEERVHTAVEEQVKSERMKIELITNVSHDLKTPLTSVIGYIELMKKEENSETMEKYIEVLSRKTDILKKMVENVFELAKASSGNIKLEIKELDLSRLIKQILADWDESITEKKKILKLDFPEKETMVQADSTYLYRIIQNLVENAIKYSLDGTRIFIRVKMQEKRVVCEIINVSNYPIEFEPETVKARFIRGDQSRNTEGNGLGLAIVETYTNMLGGSFEIVLEGDTFKSVLTFPRSKG
ncbi:MAG: HAMP domain-containing histidine kinase [Muribaculaceae bacterium]|nr:HAMP domain-containing histidine kinase [Roseburia sp.]MCM1430027.1 HAMP domain-containing histidine kinase [Muribaculaceae bacterium]MCM1492946.1 HAMP domain-containing histidine kinase [Muribaculaceae bacterium]